MLCVTVADWTKHHTSEAMVHYLGNDCLDPIDDITVVKGTSNSSMPAIHQIGIAREATQQTLPTLLQEASKHARMGSNLGLPICLRLAAAMSGSVGMMQVCVVL